MLIFITNLYLWLGLVFVHKYSDETHQEFFNYLNSKRLNKISCFYRNWVGYLLSTNPNYYWLFWKLLEGQCQNDKFYKHKLYYHVYWIEFDGEQSFF